MGLSFLRRTKRHNTSWGSLFISLITLFFPTKSLWRLSTNFYFRFLRQGRSNSWHSYPASSKCWYRHAWRSPSPEGFEQMEYSLWKLLSQPCLLILKSRSVLDQFPWLLFLSLVVTFPCCSLWQSLSGFQKTWIFPLLWTSCSRHVPFLGGCSGVRWQYFDACRSCFYDVKWT